MHSYAPEKCLRIPTDSRLYIASMWLAAVILMFLNSFVDRYDGYHLGIPAILLALGASSWTMAALNAYSRRVMLEVISWEHQQLRAEQQPGRSLAAVD